jgi:CubicO group peptidase (beta-lactamase class C family)
MALFTLTRPGLRRAPGAALDGFLHPDFSEFGDALARQLRRYGGGAAVCVYHRGECVVDLWGGVRDGGGHPWQCDTMAPSFSTTKGVASTLLHIMVDRGLLDYDDRVVEYWPEFGQAGKDEITLRQVMAHQSGLYHIRQMIDHADRMCDWEHMIAAIERTPPVHPPGERTGYHGLTYGFLVGEILQRVTGMRFSELVRKEIAEPLGLDGMYIGTPESELSRAAELLWPRRFPKEGSGIDPLLRRLGATCVIATDLLRPFTRAVRLELDVRSLLDALAPRGISAFDFGSSETLRSAIPSGNGLFTARSLARMYAALAGDGSIGGVRLLSRAALERATRLQNEAPGRAVLPIDMRWRLGYHGVFTSRGIPRRAFGHFGFGGSGAWADPRRNLAIAMIVNSGMGTPFGDLRIVRMGGVALSSADRRSGRIPRWQPFRAFGSQA